eukprot:106772-Prorocentrum_minimum.AAC.1
MCVVLGGRFEGIFFQAGELTRSCPSGPAGGRGRLEQSGGGGLRPVPRAPAKYTSGGRRAVHPGASHQRRRPSVAQ